MVRAFICVEINESQIKQKIEDIINEIQLPGVRPVKSSQLHLTLKFLGEIPESSVAKIKESLQTIESVSFNITLTGMGCFPNLNYIKVIWIGITDGKQQLIDLSQLVENKMSGLGFPKEKRRYSPHLTLARVKSVRKDTKEHLKQKILNFKSEAFGIQLINQLILKKSTLTPKGPIYEDLIAVKLT